MLVLGKGIPVQCTSKLQVVKSSKVIYLALLWTAADGVILAIWYWKSICKCRNVRYSGIRVQSGTAGYGLFRHWPDLVVWYLWFVTKTHSIDLGSVVNRNYFLRFRFPFRLLKSYGSGSDFWKSYSFGSGSYFRKVPVPVPVPAPYLDHKKQIKKKKFGILFAFLHSKLFW